MKKKKHGMVSFSEQTKAGALSSSINYEEQ
jgi:hypothetical protein